MDTYSLMQMIKKHPSYKTQNDFLLECLQAASSGGQLDFDLLTRHLKDRLPELLRYLESQYSQYKIIQTEVLKLRCQGYQFVSFGETLYPKEFYQMEDPPLSFCFFGSPSWLLSGALSVVGSREPREDSLSWMETELGEFLNRERVHIVSGGARGIDQKAHALALRKNLPTTIVIPSGLGRIYPSSLESWKKSILDNGGCFLSEYSFEEPMKKYLFHHRNRLIAALGQMILIVEARQRSGSMISANQAARLGKIVLVVPGHPQDKNFSGNLNLIADGAHLVRDAQDLELIYRSELWTLSGSTTGVEAEAQHPH